MGVSTPVRGGQVIRVDEGRVFVTDGDAIQSFSLSHYRPANREKACENLLSLARMTGSFKARMMYERQYIQMAKRYLAAK